MLEPGNEARGPPLVKVERTSCWDMKLVMTLAILISKVQSCPSSSDLPHLQFLITYSVCKLKVGRRPGNEVDQGVVVILTFAEDHKFCTCTNLWDEIPCFQGYVTGKVQINLYVNNKECQAALTNISINTLLSQLLCFLPPSPSFSNVLEVGRPGNKASSCCM